MADRKKIDMDSHSGYRTEIDIYKNSKKRVGKRKRRRKINVKGVATLVVILALIVLAVSGIFAKNAWEISLNDKVVGYIKLKGTEKLTIEDVVNTVSSKLSGEVGTSVKIVDEITIKKVRIGNDKTVSADAVFKEISEQAVYNVDAAIIAVDGKEIGVAGSSSEAQALFDSIIEPYMTENVVEKGFVQDVTATPEYVSPDRVVSNEVLKNSLLASTMVKKTYNVVAGDTLYLIALNFGVSIEEILANNPNLGRNDMLYLGQEIIVYVAEPLISVRTVEHITTIETINKKTEYIVDDTKASDYRRIVQQGTDGEIEKITSVVRINGIVESQEVISEKIIKEAVPDIINVGAN